MSFRIHERFVIAQSWWIATELVRRNAQLRILEWHPGGGQYDALGLVDLSRGKVTVSLNRKGGSIHVMDSQAFEPIDWSEVFASLPHTIVQRIEAGAGLTPPTQTPQTQRHALSYRVIAELLARTVNSRAIWDARSAFEDTSSHGGGPIESIFNRFPSAARQRDTKGSVAVLGDASYGFWAIRKNDQIVAVLDEWGWLHLEKADPTDLMRIYEASGRSLSATIGRVLGRILK